MAPGHRNAVDSESDLAAKRPIVRATHRRNGVQGSRREVNAGTTSLEGYSMTSMAMPQFLRLVPTPIQRALNTA